MKEKEAFMIIKQTSNISTFAACTLILSKPSHNSRRCHAVPGGDREMEVKRFGFSEQEEFHLICLSLPFRQMSVEIFHQWNFDKPRERQRQLSIHQLRHKDILKKKKDCVKFDEGGCRLFSQQVEDEEMRRIGGHKTRIYSLKNYNNMRGRRD